MDLLIEKEGQRFTLSSLNVFIKDIEVTAAEVEHDRRSIKGKNGKLYFGSVHTDKGIAVTGTYYAKNEYDNEVMKDRLNSHLGDLTPFFITQMYSNKQMYDFERPGQLPSTHSDNRPYKYRYKVLLSKNIDYSFQGKSEKGLLIKVTINFITAEIPYGMTIPVDEDLTDKNYILYRGNADCSQLEYPWVIEITSTKTQGKSFTFEIDNQLFKYEGNKTIVSGDVFRLSGISFTLNDLNVNDQTNIQYFVLRKSLDQKINYTCSLSAKIKLKNKVEFYI